MKELVTWKGCARLGLTALVVYLCVRYWGSVENALGMLLNGMAAILAGVIIAYVANIPLRFFERHLPGTRGDGTRNRAGSLALTIVCVLAAVALIGLLVVPQLVNSVVTLAKEAPSAIDAITSNGFISSVIPAELETQLRGVDWESVVNDAAAWLQAGVVSSLPQIMSLFSQIAAWFMGIVFALWFLSEKDNLGRQGHRLVRNYLGEETDVRLANALGLADDCFHRYIVAQALEAVILGSLVALGCAVCQIPYAPMLGALVGAMSLIPMIGALVGAILGAFIILSVSWQQALAFLVVFFVVQQVESNFIYARVVGKSVGLEGMWPLVGVTLGGALFGIAGAFAGVPVTAIAFRLVDGDLNRREQATDEMPTPMDRLHRTLAD